MKNTELWLDGDLCQMGNQADFLRRNGFSLRRQNVYSIVKPEDAERALRLIWKNKVDGWWHYCDKYVQFGICTKQEFKDAL